MMILIRRFVIGEHGFYPWSYQWDEFYYLLVSPNWWHITDKKGQTPGVAGAMAWGMRPRMSPHILWLSSVSLIYQTRQKEGL